MSAARKMVVQALRDSKVNQAIIAHRMESHGGAVKLAQAEQERAAAALAAAEQAARAAMDALDATGAEYTQHVREFAALSELLIEVELDGMGPTRAEERIVELRAAAEVIPAELAEDDEGQRFDSGGWLPGYQWDMPVGGGRPGWEFPGVTEVVLEGFADASREGAAGFCGVHVELLDGGRVLRMSTPVGCGAQ